MGDMTGGSAAQVTPRGFVVRLHVQRRLELLGRQPSELAESGDRTSAGDVPVRVRKVEAGAVARRECDGLAVSSGEQRDELAAESRAEGEPLSELDRSAVVRCADEDDVHQK